jgi:hypothetical protein
MRYIKKFNEAVGLAEATLPLIDLITDDYRNYINEFLKPDGKKEPLTKEYNSEDLKSFINSDLWSKFPVISMKVDYSATVIDDDEFKNRYPKTYLYKNWNTSGACYNIGDKESDGSYLMDPINDKEPKNLHLRLEVGCIISDKFNNIDEMMIEAESAISHELNHAYEGWNRILSGSGQLSVDLTFALDANRPRLRKEIWKTWYNKIGFYLYWSELHEVNAMIQESWSFVKKMDLDELKTKSPSWKYAQMMTEFKADDFKKEMEEKVKEFYPEADVNFFLKSLKTGLANQLIKSRVDSKLTHQDKPSITGDKVKNMSVDQFLKYTEKRVNLAGETIKKGIMRLYSLKNNNVK